MSAIGVPQAYSPQGLPICPKCSWTITFAPNHTCDVAASKLAKRLIDALAPIPGTMYGYGEHAVAFDIGAGTIVFSVRRGALHVDHVFLSSRFKEERAAKLVRAMAEALR